MVQLTYYDDGTAWTWRGRDQQDDRAGRGSIVLRHGITLGDLAAAAGMALARNVGVSAFTRFERYDIAFSAAAVALYAADDDDPPTVSDLATAGWYAIAEARQDEMRHHGVDYCRRVGEQRPRFDRYWSWTAGPAPSPEGGVVERLALMQIWPCLTEGQREALSALAALGSAAGAAGALGKSHSAFHHIAHKGRHRFAELWHEGETPPRRIGRDRRRADGDDTGVDEGYRRWRAARLRHQHAAEGAA